MFPQNQTFSFKNMKMSVFAIINDHSRWDQEELFDDKYGYIKSRETVPLSVADLNMNPVKEKRFESGSNQNLSSLKIKVSFHVRDILTFLKLIFQTFFVVLRENKFLILFWLYNLIQVSHKKSKELNF